MLSSVVVYCTEELNEAKIIDILECTEKSYTVLYCRYLVGQRLVNYDRHRIAAAAQAKAEQQQQQLHNYGDEAAEE